MAEFLLGSLGLVFVVIVVFWIVGSKERRKYMAETNRTTKKMKEWQDALEFDYESFSKEDLVDMRNLLIDELNKPGLDINSDVIMPLDSVLLDLGVQVCDVIHYKIDLIDSMLEPNTQDSRDIRTVIDSRVGQDSYNVRKKKQTLA